MGLDSVELIIKIETYFGIEISNEDAEKIYTVQNFVDCVARYLSVQDNNKNLQKEVLSAFGFWHQNGRSEKIQIKLSDFISSYINPEIQVSTIPFSEDLQLALPKLNFKKTDGNGLYVKVKNWFSLASFYDWETVTVETYINAICAKNHSALIDKRNIKSTFEIYVIIIGITCDCMGIDYFEIGSGKSFVDDLGIN